MFAVDALAGILVVLLAVCLPLIGVAVRRRLLQRQGGAVDLSLRLHRLVEGRGWVLGVGRFEGDALRWYRVFSLAPGPRRTLSRVELSVVRRRAPSAGERLALLHGATVLECLTADGPVELAIDNAAVTGLLAWLEARPPGATPPL